MPKGETRSPTPDFPEVISNTARSAWLKCETYFWRYIIQSLRLRALNIHLEAGGAFAKSLCESRRAFYEKKLEASEAENVGLQALYDTYPKEEMDPARSGDKSVEGMVRGYESYMLEHPFHSDFVQPLILPNGRAAVEFSFASPLEVNHPVTGNPILFSGRFDMLGVFNNSLFVVDEKTASQLGEQWKRNWDLDSQFTGYVWGAKQFGHPVVGAVIRGIGLLKTKTTHEEVITYRPPWVIDRWYDETNTIVERMITAWKNKKYLHALDKFQCNSYGGCPMKLLCESPNPDQYIESHYMVRPYDPLADR